MPAELPLDYWLGLLRRRYRFIGGIGLLAGVLTLGVLLLLPRWYQARTTILPPRDETSLLNRSEGLAAALQMPFHLPFSEGISRVDIYLAILNSDKVASSLVERFDLRGRYGCDSMSEADRTLRSHSGISLTPGRVIEVEVEDKDPGMAAALANAYVEELDRVFRSTRSTASRRQRIFLESRVRQAASDLAAADSALARAQAGKGVTAMTRDLSEAAAAAGDLLGRRMALSVQLDMYDEMGMSKSPARVQAALQLDALEREIKKLPYLGLEIARKLRDAKLNETLYEELARHLETARIEEVRDMPAVEVLDPAVTPTRHSRPRRGLGAVAGTVIGVVLATIWSAYREQRGR